MPAASSAPGASLYGSKKKKTSPLAVVQAVAQAAQAAQAAATAVAQTSPSYVAPTSSSSTATSSSSPTAPSKPPPSLAKEFIKDPKKPKTVSGKYAKASEKAQAKRAKESAKVKRKTAEVTKKYMKTPKFGPGNAYTVWEGSNKIASKARELSAARSPKKDTGGRQKPSTGLSGPKPRKVASRLEKAVKQAKPTFDGLDSEQSKVLRTVLNQGVRAGADRKTLLSAVETGLVESGLRNLDYGDADSQGWRQERSMYYDNPTNVKASAKRYFQEAAEARTPGMTAGNIAQAAQQSAFPERYDQVAGQAKPLLKEFTSTRREAVPPKLKQTAKQTLGKKPTKAILRGGTVVKDPKAGEKTKATGKWGGARDAVLAQIPKEFWPDAKGDKRTPEENAAVGGSSTSDHLTTNTTSYAADLPADDNLAKQIADNLGLSSHTGTQTVEKDGVRYQLIWQDAGHYDHIHLGAQVGDGASITNPNIPIKGTKLAVKVPVISTGAVSTGGVSSPVSSPVSAGTSAAQVAAELKRRGVRSPSLRKRLAKIDRWMTSPLTAETPEISQELIDRILGK